MRRFRPFFSQPALEPLRRDRQHVIAPFAPFSVEQIVQTFRRVRPETDGKRGRNSRHGSSFPDGARHLCDDAIVGESGQGAFESLLSKAPPAKVQRSKVDERIARAPATTGVLLQETLLDEALDIAERGIV